MAPVQKKARRPIGSMLDTVVQETQNQINNDDRSNSDGSDNHSRTSETPISSTDESDHDETQNNGDDNINGQVFFSSQLGILAKDGNKLPISYTDWRAVSNAQKDLIWTEIKKLSKINKNSRKHVKLPARLGRKDMANATEECRREYGKEPSKLDLFVYTRQSKNGKPLDKKTAEKIAILQDLKKQLPENLRDDIRANDEIYEDVLGTEAPGCLRSTIVGSKSKEVKFTTREEFDRAVQEKSNDMVANIQKNFEEEMSKFKEDYSSKMEMLQVRLLSLEGHNINESGYVNSRRIQAFNIGSSNEGFMNSKNSSDATERAETEEELNNSDETDINIHSDGARVQETLEKTTRRSTRKTKVT